MNTTLPDKNSCLKTSVNFLKSFLLFIVFAAVLAVFFFVRGFVPSERPVVAASFLFVLLNLLIYSYQSAAGLYRRGETAFVPAVWTVLMALPGLNILVFAKMHALNKKMLLGMQIERIPLHALTTRRLGFTMMVSLALVVGVLNWLTMTKVTGLTKLRELKEAVNPETPYAKAFKESADLMSKGEYYQGLQLLRNTQDMTPRERETYDRMLKAGYQGHAFVLSERILNAVKAGETEGQQQTFVEYLRWMDIYCESMDIPKATLTQLRDDVSHMAEVFPADKGASFQEIRNFYQEKAGTLTEDEPARALLQAYVDVLLFTALQNIQNSSKAAVP